MTEESHGIDNALTCCGIALVIISFGVLLAVTIDTSASNHRKDAEFCAKQCAGSSVVECNMPKFKCKEDAK